MKKSFLFLALVLIFTQCQVPPIIQSPPSPQELDAVCDSISSGLYFPGQYFNLKGRIIIDYTTAIIDSSDNDSVRIYINVSAQIDMDYNKIEHTAQASTYPLDTPTHVCLAGGICGVIANSQPNHTQVFSIPGCSVFKMIWSGTSGLMKSSNSVKVMVLNRPKLSGTIKHPALLPNYNVANQISIQMAGKNWWIITINNKKQRYNGGILWNYM